MMAVICSSAVVLLLVKHCLLLLPLFVLVLYLFFFCNGVLSFLSSFAINYLRKKRAGHFPLFVLCSHMDTSVLCLSSWCLGLVCSDYGISWSYSLTLYCREDMLHFVYFWMNTL